MKPNFILPLAIAVCFLYSIGGCKKEDSGTNNQDDWATAVAGVYTNTQAVNGTSNNLVTYFTVTRAGNKNLVIKIDRDATGTIAYSLHTCIDSVLMSTASTFAVDESDNCDTADYWAVHGSGSFTPNSLTINWTTERDAPAPYNSYNYSMIATK